MLQIHFVFFIQMFSYICWSRGHFLCFFSVQCTAVLQGEPKWYGKQKMTNFRIFLLQNYTVLLNLNYFNWITGVRSSSVLFQRWFVWEKIGSKKTPFWQSLEGRIKNFKKDQTILQTCFWGFWRHSDYIWFPLYVYKVWQQEEGSIELCRRFRTSANGEKQLSAEFRLKFVFLPMMTQVCSKMSRCKCICFPIGLFCLNLQ